MEQRKNCWLALAAVVISALGLAAVCFAAFSDLPDVVAVVACVAVVAVVAGVAVVAVVAGVAVVAVVAVVAGGGDLFVFLCCICLTMGAVLSVLVSYNRETKKVGSSVFLWLILLYLPLIVFVPLSKYHNIELLERDKEVVAALQVSSQADGTITVVLPVLATADYQSYLKKTASIIATETKMGWREAAIKCQRGGDVWYKMEKVPNAPDGVKVVFHHSWWDHEGVLKPNQEAPPK